MKSYTDLDQSKKLAEILPLESADMVIWGRDLDAVAATDAQKFMSGLKDRKMNYLPCWSLAALLSIIPKHIKDYNVLRVDISENDFAIWYDEIGFGVNNDLPDITADNPVDACVAMVEKLHKLNLL